MNCTPLETVSDGNIYLTFIYIRAAISLLAIAVNSLLLATLLRSIVQHNIGNSLTRELRPDDGGSTLFKVNMLIFNVALADLLFMLLVFVWEMYVLNKYKVSIPVGTLLPADGFDIYIACAVMVSMLVSSLLLLVLRPCSFRVHDLKGQVCLTVLSAWAIAIVVGFVLQLIIYYTDRDNNSHGCAVWYIIIHDIALSTPVVTCILALCAMSHCQNCSTNPKLSLAFGLVSTYICCWFPYVTYHWLTAQHIRGNTRLDSSLPNLALMHEVTWTLFVFKSFVTPFICAGTNGGVRCLCRCRICPLQPIPHGEPILITSREQHGSNWTCTDSDDLLPEIEWDSQGMNEAKVVYCGADRTTRWDGEIIELKTRRELLKLCAFILVLLEPGNWNGRLCTWSGAQD
uniref:Uncharacterized protein n=1 Tax=Eptatretus burgeri TaxID=7764 RepID=A0A8C4WX23_EPTBU